MISRALRIVCNVVSAMLLVAFTVLVVASPTLGAADFHQDYYSDSEVTTALQQSLKEKTDQIAKQTGVESGAFDYAVGPIKIDGVKNQIVQAIFSGTNYDYSDSSGIRTSYSEGIKEYYRFNGLNIDDETLNKAVNMACNAFNETFGVSNNSQLSKFVVITSKYSMMGAVVALVLFGVAVSQIFALNMGRTKSFAHLGCALISAGFGLVTMFLLNLVMNFTDKLYLTNNAVVNTAISGAVDKYFVILAIFGAVFIGLGITAIKFTYNYYSRKFAAYNQELMINKKIMLENNKPLPPIDRISMQNIDFIDLGDTNI